VAPPSEKVMTMPTQKVFKHRVRTRMTKTGESYTTARQQLLRKTEPPPAPEPGSDGGSADLPSAPVAAARAPGSAAADLLVSEEAMVRATGKGHEAWFALLDEWGGTAHNHTEIARWVHQAQGVPGWWAQNITVAYERVRGMRRPGQMANGFSVAVTRTIGAEPAAVLAAFTDVATRERWLPDAPLRPRPTRARLVARFDWAEPDSRVVVGVVPKADGKTVVSVVHEKIPEAGVGEELKARWRAALGELKALLETR
jgi:uncharacterized protein YndB with AHSA1/START domain